MKKEKISSSAPGRICLFGEHQDYLGFPVIAAAIDLRMTIDGEITPGGEDRLTLELPDVGKTLEFSSDNIRYSDKKDYLKSTVNVLKNRNLYVPATIRARFHGNVPIQAGTSSSAAMSVAWTGFLLQAAKQLGIKIDNFPGDPAFVAELAYSAEVEEFNESGGRMDQYSSAFGGIIYIELHETMEVSPLPMAMKEFVLGDSLQPKDTQKTLKRGRTAQGDALQELNRFLDFRDNFHLTYTEAEPFKDKITPGLRPYLEAALINHEITAQARDEMKKDSPDIQKLAGLMNRHQAMLRDNLNVSTTKIDHMLDKAMEAGALAGKINGSGEGGCMFAFCPGKQQEVAEAIERAGGIPYIINIGPGVEVFV